jgi:DNA-binding PadR family transcriptional regulator
MVDVRDEPLRPPVFHILLALASADLHGLGIAEEVERATDGAVELGPGTLYRSLKEMARGGLIAEVAPPAEDTDPRRKYYRLRPPGRAVLAREATRLARVVELARQRDVLPERA